MSKNVLSSLEGSQCPVLHSLKKAYGAMLTPYKDRLGDFENGVTASPFLKGAHYTENSYHGEPLRILFVGRAMNGWEVDFENCTVEEMVERVFKSTDHIADVAKGKFRNEKGEVVYNYNKSPFFQLCHKVMNLYGIEENWSEHMAWSNLYKISPYKGGNPNNKLIAETLDMCADILHAEIAYLRPTHIVFITDDWWYKPDGKNLFEHAFINKTGVDLYEDKNKVVIGGGLSEGFDFWPKPNIVITKRPEGAKMSRAEHAKAIFDAFADNALLGTKGAD